MDVKHLLSEILEGICTAIDKITYFLLTLLLETDAPFLIKLAKQKQNETNEVSWRLVPSIGNFSLMH